MTKRGPEGPLFLALVSWSGPRSGGLGDPITLDALRADPDPSGRPVYQDSDGLKVGIPAPVRPVLGAAHVMTGDRPLGADGPHPCHRSVLLRNPLPRNVGKP